LGETAAERNASVPPAPGPRPPERPGGLLRDLVNLYLRPGTLFAGLPVRNRSAAALLLLMALQALYAAGVVSTGVLDYEIDADTQKVMSRYADQPHSDESAEDVNRVLDALAKGGTFTKLLTRVLLIAGGPVQAAAAAGLLASVLFVVVALRGTAKPDFHLLAAVAIFAAYALVPRLLVRLFLVSQLQVSRVETSAAAFVAPPYVSLGLYLLLRRLDPFDAWYWALVGLGVWKTGQLSGRAAVVTVVVLAVLAALLQVALDLPELAIFPTNLPGSP
jgi:hypothetical protein